MSGRHQPEQGADSAAGLGSLCVCGHPSDDHVQHDDGEYCYPCKGTCSRYRKAADVSDLKSTAILSAGVTPEGLAGETVSETVKPSALGDHWRGFGKSPQEANPAVNEAAEQLLTDVIRNIGVHPSDDRLLALWKERVDKALATERRNTVERIRVRLSPFGEGAGADVLYGGTTITVAQVRAILDEVAS